jgi:hypothetical protein
MSIIYIPSALPFITLLIEQLCSCNTSSFDFNIFIFGHLLPLLLHLPVFVWPHPRACNCGARASYIILGEHNNSVSLYLNADLARLPLLLIILTYTMELQQNTNSTVSGGKLAHVVAS